jgi:hypothetical protein
MITIAIERLHQSHTDDEIANAIFSIDHQLSHAFQRLLPKTPIAEQRLQRKHSGFQVNECHSGFQGFECPTTAPDGFECPIDGIDGIECPTTALEGIECPTTALDGNELVMSRIPRNHCSSQRVIETGRNLNQLC